MYKLNSLYKIRKDLFNIKNPQEVVFFFNTTAAEANYKKCHGFNVYMCSQIYNLHAENALVLSASAHPEQESLFVSALGYLQKSNKVLMPPYFSLEMWKVSLLVVNSWISAADILLIVELVDSDSINLFNTYLNNMTKHTLFSNKLITFLVLTVPVLAYEWLVHISPFIGYITNYYTTLTVTKLSRFMVLCAEKNKKITSL